MSFLVYVSSHGIDPSLSGTDNVPTKVIQSGFEPDTELYQYNDSILGIRGIDRSVALPNNWAAIPNNPPIGNVYFQMESPGTTADRKVTITADPVNPENHVLAFWLYHATEPDPMKGRVSFNIGENSGLRGIYYKVSVFLPTDFDYVRSFTPQSGDWLTLMELWGNPDWTDPAPYPFRITLYAIKTPDNQNLEFGVEAQTMDPGHWQTVWRQAADTFVLPINEWFTTEVYYKEGDASHGKFWLAVTPQSGQRTVLFNITNATYHPQNPSPSGLKWINPMKLYCSAPIIDWVNQHGGTLHIFFDDFEFWKDKQPEG